jgi:hypothetical protein
VRAILLLGLVVAVCFAGAGSAATRPTAAETKREAKLVAARLLALFVPPHGAVRLKHEPLGDQGFLRRRTFSIGGQQSVYRHDFWRVNHRLDSVVSFVKAHPPKGAVRPGGSGTSGGSGIPANKSLDFVIQHSRGQRATDWIEVTMVALSPGSTGIRVDSSAGWIIPRSPREKVPAGVREIDIHSPHFSRRVTQTAKVQTIVHWFDALGIVQGGQRMYGCPAIIGGSTVVLDFRSASRALLAQARLNPRSMSTECNPIEFSIHGHRQTPLVGLTFWNRVKRLIGISSR